MGDPFEDLVRGLLVVGVDVELVAVPAEGDPGDVELLGQERNVVVVPLGEVVCDLVAVAIEGRLRLALHEVEDVVDRRLVDRGDVQRRALPAVGDAGLLQAVGHGPTLHLAPVVEVEHDLGPLGVGIVGVAGVAGRRVLWRLGLAREAGDRDPRVLAFALLERIGELAHGAI